MLVVRGILLVRLGVDDVWLWLWVCFVVLVFCVADCNCGVGSVWLRVWVWLCWFDFPWPLTPENAGRYLSAFHSQALALFCCDCAFACVALVRRWLCLSALVLFGCVCGLVVLVWVVVGVVCLRWFVGFSG